MNKWLAIAALLFTTSVNATPVNINTADATLIAKSLYGVGSARAKEIVKYREKNGAFRSVNELRKVIGVGSRIIEKNRKDILLMDPS